MSKYTPGPWTVASNYPNAKTAICHSSPLQKLASAHSDVQITGAGTQVISPEEAEANAYLIAAAPELLDACKAAEAELEQWTMAAGVDAILEVVRAAIAKAEGTNE